MDNQTEVVAEESNSVNEDLTIDNAIRELFSESEDKTSEPVSEEAPNDEEELESEGSTVEEEQEEAADLDAELADEVDGDTILPNNMPKELQDSLSKFDEDVQREGAEVFKKMQSSFTKKNQEFAEQKKVAEEIDDTFIQAGLEVDKKTQFIRNYVAFDNLFASNPKAAVQQLLDYAGLKPEDFGAVTPPAGSSESEDEYLSDAEIQTKQRINELTEQVSQLTKHIQATSNQAQDDIVARFRDAKDEKGELLNPHFNAVKQDMMDLAAINPKLTIEELYKKAVRMNDNLSAQIIESEKKKAIEELQAKRKAEVNKAKKLSRQSRPTSSVDSSVVDEDAIFKQIANAAGFG
jgi:hypothetical protein